MQFNLSKSTTKELENVLLKKEILQSQMKLLDYEMKDIINNIRIEFDIKLNEKININSELTLAIVERNEDIDV